MSTRFHSLIFCIVLIFGAILHANSQPFIGSNKLYYGVAYYPEGWNASEIDRDIQYMKKAGINVVRMAEFSWYLMEPTEGNFHFDWLHSIIEKLHLAGIDVVLGTPTATPPAWMAYKYPEIFEMDENGIRKTHGARRNCNFSSPVYFEKSRIIIEKMAAEFGRKPGVIGWQTDNEFHLNYDYSNVTEQRWHQWLKETYGTIETINAEWNLVLWSQSYNAIEHIPMPRADIWHHPSLQLAWYRFNNYLVDEFQDMQLSVIRKHSDLPITHDGMPGQTMDYEMLFDDLDFVAVNNYHSFEAYDRIQSNYDRARGYGKGFHWLFETAPNYSGGGKKGNTWFLHLPEGSMRAALWMNYAMGGQGAMFWLWRQHWAGQEMPHGSFLSSWGKPAANFDDLSHLGNELARMSDMLMNNPVAPTKAAILWSHQNNFMLRVEEYANGIQYYNDWTYRFYRPIADAYIHRDVIGPGMDIKPYKILFMPIMPMMDEGYRIQLRDWVTAGGILILGPMSGYRSDEWTSFKDHALGSISTWAGIEVDSRIPIGTKRRPAEEPCMITFDKSLNLQDAEGGLWSESLSSDKGIVLARYTTGMHNGLPAIIENRVGKGKIIVLGTDPGKAAYQKLALTYAREAGIEPLATGDDQLVIVPRKGNDNLLVLINLANEEKSVEIPESGYQDVLNPEKLKFDGKITLQPYDVFILRK